MSGLQYNKVDTSEYQDRSDIGSTSLSEASLPSEGTWFARLALILSLFAPALPASAAQNGRSGTEAGHIDSKAAARELRVRRAQEANETLLSGMRSSAFESAVSEATRNKFSVGNLNVTVVDPQAASADQQNQIRQQRHRREELLLALSSMMSPQNNKPRNTPEQSLVPEDDAQRSPASTTPIQNGVFNNLLSSNSPIEELGTFTGPLGEQRTVQSNQGDGRVRTCGVLPQEGDALKGFCTERAKDFFATELEFKANGPKVSKNDGSKAGLKLPSFSAVEQVGRENLDFFAVNPDGSGWLFQMENSKASGSVEFGSTKESNLSFGGQVKGPTAEGSLSRLLSPDCINGDWRQGRFTLGGSIGPQFGGSYSDGIVRLSEGWWGTSFGSKSTNIPTSSLTDTDRTALFELCPPKVEPHKK